MLVRKRKAPSDPAALRNIGVHPELYKALRIQAIEGGQTLRERLHAVLCRALKRPDLLGPANDRASA